MSSGSIYPASPQAQSIIKDLPEKFSKSDLNGLMAYAQAVMNMPAVRDLVEKEIVRRVGAGETIRGPSRTFTLIDGSRFIVPTDRLKGAVPGIAAPAAPLEESKQPTAPAEGQKS